MIARITDARRIGVIAALLLGAVGCGVHSHMNSTTGVPGYQSDTQSIEMISAVVGGKNIFIPSTVVVTGGAPQTLSVFNTTDKPHGFAIPGLDIQVVLLAGEETQIDLPPLAGGEIYRIGCHLHPPHRSATLVVVPGR
jgi:uncharacterized membrane protein YeaQ/YmgE (transglycosylase-associated protein family)